MKRIVVIGLGNFGMAVAESLARKGVDVIAVDRRQELVDHIAEWAARSVVCDGTNATVLREVGGKGADVGIVSTGDDITASILAVLALKDIGVRDIHVKVISEQHARVVDKLGVASTVFPERDSGRRLAESVVTQEILSFIPLSDDFAMQEMAIPDSWLGESLKTLDIRRRFNIGVVAVKDMLTGSMAGVPDPEAPLKDSDTLFVSGAPADLARVATIR
jgi:trk system potassium uptake protein TrkA